MSTNYEILSKVNVHTKIVQPTALLKDDTDECIGCYTMICCIPTRY